MYTSCGRRYTGDALWLDTSHSLSLPRVVGTSPQSIWIRASLTSTISAMVARTNASPGSVTAVKSLGKPLYDLWIVGNSLYYLAEALLSSSYLLIFSSLSLSIYLLLYLTRAMYDCTSHLDFSGDSCWIHTLCYPDATDALFLDYRCSICVHM